MSIYNILFNIFIYYNIYKYIFNNLTKYYYIYLLNNILFII